MILRYLSQIAKVLFQVDFLFSLFLDFKEKMRELLVQDQFDRVLRYLGILIKIYPKNEIYRDTVLSIQSQHRELQQQRKRNEIPEEDFQIRKNRLLGSLLKIISEIELPGLRFALTGILMSAIPVFLIIFSFWMVLFSSLRYSIIIEDCEGLGLEDIHLSPNNASKVRLKKMDGEGVYRLYLPRKDRLSVKFEGQDLSCKCTLFPKNVDKEMTFCKEDFGKAQQDWNSTRNCVCKPK